MTQCLGDQASDSEEVVTPLMLDGTYLWSHVSWLLVLATTFLFSFLLFHWSAINCSPTSEREEEFLSLTMNIAVWLFVPRLLQVLLLFLWSAINCSPTSEREGKD